MKSFKFSLAFFFAFSVTIYAQSDKPKQKYDDPVPRTAQITRDTTSEEKLWETITGKFEHLEVDSSKNNSIRRIAIFEGVKIQMRKNTGNLATVEKWEYRFIKNSYGTLALYIFTLQNRQKIIISLRPIDDYRKVTLYIASSGLQETSIEAFAPNNKENSDLTKVTLKF